MISSGVLVQVKGWQRSFQPSMKASMAAIRSLTEVKVPRRMACRVMMPKKISSGSAGALLHRGPLRTGRARFRATGSGKPGGLAGWQRCCPTAPEVDAPVQVADVNDEDARARHQLHRRVRREGPTTLGT